MAVERRVQADLDSGRNDELVAELEALVAAHPLRETLCRHLMRALYRSGRQADALAAFEATRRRLADELGIEPSPALRILHHQLLNQVDPAPAPVERRRAPVPALPDRTIGREGDLETLDALLSTADCRLLTIVGPGGVGKTRVVLELGHRLAGRYADGVAFVSLAEAQTPADVAPTISAALGISARAADLERTLATALRGRDMVLICDNFEHVLDAAGLLATLLADTSGLRVVATSRRPLELRGERQYVLGPLPAADSAVELFLARMPAGHAAVAEADRALVASICRQCDGLPLAIELAAARTVALSLAELDDRLHEPLPLLIAGPRDAPARHRTLRASIASSVEALDPADQAQLAALSVFRGGFTVAGAAAVNELTHPGALRLIEILAGHSLIGPATVGGEPRRFDLLQTVREYLDEQLSDGDRDRLQARHAEFVLATVGAVTDPAWHPYHVANLRWQLNERPNIRAAVRYAQRADRPDLFADLVISTGALWIRLGPHTEAAEWLRAIVADQRVAAGRRADAFTRMAWLTETTSALGAVADLMAQAQSCMDGLDDPRRQAWVHAYDSWYRMLAGDADGAARLLDATRECCDRAGQPPELVYGIHDIAMVAAAIAGDVVTAEREARLMVGVARQHRLDAVLPLGLSALCEIALLRDAGDEVLVWADEGLRLAAATGAHDLPVYLLSQRGMAQLNRGDLPAAAADLRAALSQYVEAALGVDGLEVVLRLAAVYARAGNMTLATELTRRFDEGAQGTAVGVSPLVSHVRERHLSGLPSTPVTGTVIGTGQHYLDVYRDVLALITADPPG